ncbi:hypothetical protein 2 [Hubei myriapoda virus 8]|uniref:Uncharacterized protein n=1 Tax=Hubei myriapoda virus 8 TaxID=1922937 RepID=A0A1L3KN84_9VIRU|nr:hypothetical protein 2 [Hubei myriapoda virus 8]APG78799.1 hypothetical protein 2 [Hubei myriapoda virus 8]
MTSFNATGLPTIRPGRSASVPPSTEGAHDIQKPAMFSTMPTAGTLLKPTPPYMHPDRPLTKGDFDIAMKRLEAQIADLTQNVHQSIRLHQQAQGFGTSYAPPTAPSLYPDMTEQLHQGLDRYL